MQLLIIRHADPDYRNNTITPAGHLEAAALADRLEREGVDRIYTSPLGRAMDTMRHTADRLGKPHTVLEWTREQHPELFVDAPGHGSGALFQFPGEIYREKAPLPTRENWHELPAFDTVRPQMLSAVETIIRESDAFLASFGFQREGTRYRLLRSNPERVAIFCHAGLALTWIAHLLEIPMPLFWSGFWIAPSSVTTILMEERSANWAVPRCTGLGDTGHLLAAGLPRSPRGLEANLR
jgi:broad specificity phosphatase PhoE